MEHLSKILGHSSLVITQRYAHLRPDLFAKDVRGLFGGGSHWQISGEVVSIGGPGTGQEPGASGAGSR